LLSTLHRRRIAVKGFPSGAAPHAKQTRSMWVRHYDAAGVVHQARPDTMLTIVRAEVAELEDALDSKSSGASPRAGSIPAFGTCLPSMQLRDVMRKQTTRRPRS
jgi:hypothetical protein